MATCETPGVRCLQLYVNSTQAELTSEEGISVEKLLPTDWPTGLD